MEAPRRLATSRVSSTALEDDGLLLLWDVAREKLAELLRYVAAALPELAAWLRNWAATVARRARSALAVAVPAAAAVALVLVLCCCCGYCCFSACGGRRRRRGPDGEEAGGGDGPVVSYRCGGGGYRGGIFSLHPNKPIRG
ncbi:hypothetical protein E2562_033455 [Oryza meyeriana var. granulata]|uniref:Uncharacterized protein n=1 Tax=Oryza meyeriana var. granulata TaxID=110450 RepID=A0A6G1E874_9ORYZ|nr:hypothetical protein E2562_033455 [Oryza meyeriana var. granulata]